MPPNRRSPPTAFEVQRPAEHVPVQPEEGLRVDSQAQTDPNRDLASDWRGRHPREWLQRAGQDRVQRGVLALPALQEGRDANHIAERLGDT